MIYPSVVGVDDCNLCCSGGEETDDRHREASHGIIVGFIFTLQSPNSQAEYLVSGSDLENWKKKTIVECLLTNVEVHPYISVGPA